MSKAAFWQRGETLDYTNDSSSKIEANTIIVYGSRIGVIGTDIVPDEMGSLHVTGVFEFPKAAVEITAGAEVYYSEIDGITTAATRTITDPDDETKTKTVNNVNAGFAVSGAASDAGTVLVKINA